ncbi:MAG: hypothetical protein JST68_10235, partial [Bacteroidetes bacterium]|nr:hypothetical protein [Bacteroidota bacterium]
MTRHNITFFLLLILTHAVQAQTVAGLPETPRAGGYDPVALFAPGFYN